MKCPRCSVIVGQRSSTCHGCEFSLTELTPVFGNRCVQMDRLHDDAHCLLKADRDKVMATMDLFEARFPQLFFCAYLSALPEGTKLSELGFWLLNYAAVRSVDIDRPNENALILVVDLHAKRVGISLGYYAELLLDEAEVARALNVARPWFMNAEFGTGINSVLKQLGKQLSKNSRTLRSRPLEATESLLNPFGQPQMPALRTAKSRATKKAAKVLV